jgi:hypothetical protein
MGAFAGIEKTTTYKNAPFLEPGQYDLAVKSVSLVTSKKLPARNFFVAEFDVVSSTCDKFATGDLVSWLVDMSHGETSLSNIKAFAASVMDCDEAEIDEPTMERLIGPDQPATGARVKANAFTIKTRSGSDFTKVRWDSVA